MISKPVRVNQCEMVKNAIVRHPCANASEIREFVLREYGRHIERIQARLGDLDKSYEILQVQRTDGTVGFKLGLMRLQEAGRKALHLQLPRALPAKDAERLERQLRAQVEAFCDSLPATTGTVPVAKEESWLDKLLTEC